MAEGLAGIAHAITATMTAPDAGPHLQLLEALNKAVIGAIQGPPAGKTGAPGQAAPGGQPGGAPGGMGGGTNIQQLMGGGGPQPPSAGAGGGPSPTGMSADDLRRGQAAMAGTAG